MHIYLAGPMSGVPLHKASGWRGYLTRTLTDQGHTVFDPTAAVMNKIMMEERIAESYPKVGVRTKDTFNIDIYQLRNSDVVIANLKDWNEKSFGTAFEFGVAWSFGIPIICIPGEKAENPFVCEPCMLVDDLEDAIELILNFE